MKLSGNTEAPPQGGSSASSSLDEVKRMRSQLSLKLIRGLDANVESIIYQTPFVTAYQLNSNNQWERADIEGFLYVLQRVCEPKYCLILVNRKSEHHLIEYITPEFQVTAEDHFIFYHSKDIKSDSMNNIRGLWFFDEKECMKSYEKITSVTINTEPLSGFNRNSNTVTPNGDDSTTQKTVGDPLSQHAPDAPSGSKPASRASEPRSGEGATYPDMAVMQQRSLMSNISSRDADSSDHDAGYPAPPDFQNRPKKPVDKLASLFQPFMLPENQSHLSRPPLPRQMKVATDHVPKHMHAKAHYDPREPTVTVTYEGLCRAFNEALMSEDFVRLVWLRLRGLDSNQ